jgi:hypothetical protein
MDFEDKYKLVTLFQLCIKFVIIKNELPSDIEFKRQI